MIGDTVVSQFAEPRGMFKVVGANYQTDAEGNFSGTIDVVDSGKPEVYTLDVLDVKVIFFDQKARDNFHFGEEPDIVY